MTDPGNSQHFSTPAPRQHTNRGLLVILGVLLAALGIAVAVLLIGDGEQNDGDPRAGGSTTTSSVTTGPFDAGSSELPEVVVGSWEGTVAQGSSGMTYTVQIELTPTSGNEVGNVVYPTLSCSGYYSLTEVTEDTITMVEHITDGTEDCVDGVEISLHYVDETQLFYSFPYGGVPEDGKATLSRSE